VIIDRAEHPVWLSNAYLVADEPGGHGVLIDGNGVIEPLLARAAREEIEITHLLLTHHHADHVVEIDALKQRLGVPVAASALTAAELEPGLVDQLLEDGARLRSGGLELVALATPGHARGHLAFLVGSECFTADVLFKGTVGGTRGAGGNYAELRESVMDRLLTLPAATSLHPGHREPTSVAAEWEHNPFVRVWRGLDPEGAEPCLVAGQSATLLLFAPDYDGGHKALVRFGDDEVAIVGGSQVTRLP
jgi:glyoxylase-like metal-dependent hydrolase (beta-lactamase superfamily II)